MNYPKLSNKKCKHCQNRIPMKRKRDEAKEFCNRRCASQFLFGRAIEKDCKFCGATFTTTPGKGYKFCSKNCANKSRSVIHLRECEWCGKQFVLDNIAYERRGNGRFCSVECGTRTYYFDQSYFEKIDTEEKSYWLGFLFADGNVYRTQMTLKLQRTDRAHLEKFKKALSSEHPIHDGQNEAHKNSFYSVFYIGSKKLCADLIELDMTPKKSFTLKFPSIPKHLHRHFIRGFFDGDGCIYIGKKDRRTWSIFSVSEKFITEVKRIMESSLNLTLCLNKQGSGFVLHTGKQDNIPLLKKYLYDDASICLERKYNKF